MTREDDVQKAFDVIKGDMCPECGCSLIDDWIMHKSDCALGSSNEIKYNTNSKNQNITIKEFYTFLREVADDDDEVLLDGIISLPGKTFASGPPFSATPLTGFDPATSAATPLTVIPGTIKITKYGSK